ncbi:MAG: RidA family protein [Defluviitaleaceae bacterium]|nr:RidA family protein [Defluviitaleaceae bacterium]
MNAERELARIGIKLDGIDHSGCGVVPVRRCGDMLFVSASYPADKTRGRVGADLTEEEGYEAARMCATSMLAILKDYLGDLDKIEEWVKVLGLVNSGGCFDRMPKVINGFSDVIVSAFGAKGRHARSAMGTANHESGYAVAVDAIVRIKS